MQDFSGKPAGEEWSPYAPIRLRGQLWWKYAVLAGKDGYVTSDGRIASTLPEMIEQSIATAYITGFHAEVKHLPEAPALMGTHIAKVMQFRHWIPLAAQYELCGRQIFDLHDELVELLRNTDLGECTLEGWKRPYDAFFVRFGRQESIKIPFEHEEFEYLDGAFIACTPFGEGGDEYRLKMGFTTAKKDGRGVMLPGYFIDFQPHEQKMLVSDAIEASLARKMAEFADEGDASAFDKALNSHRRIELEDSVALLRAGATLLVNSLFYLESLGGKAPDPSPGRDTPPSRAAKWLQSNPVQRNKQRSSLTADGYAIVRVVGQELAGTPAGGASVSAQRRSHWRRGHWRWQRHGAALAERKRIWIKPVMVGIENAAADEEVPGHIYMTSGSDRVQ